MQQYKNQICYTVEKILYKSHRFIIYKASDKNNNEYVIKKISLENTNEVEVWKEIKEKSYFVKLLTSFTSEHENSISLIFEYLPNNLSTLQKINHQEFKNYIHQLLLSLDSLHKQGFVHCGISSQNCLIKGSELKLYDFSVTQKINTTGKFEIITNYTPPEIILGNYQIHESIDIWQAGCVISEILIGAPLFQGTRSVDILASIMKTLGSPTQDEIQQMTNNRIKEAPIQIKKTHLIEVFKNKVDFYLVDLISRMLKYNPSERITVLQAIEHPFFRIDPPANTKQTHKHELHEYETFKLQLE